MLRNRPTFRLGAGLRWLIACGVAVLGFATTHAFVSGSVAALRASTTVPTPDSPPTTAPQPTPPPPAPPAPKPRPATPPPPPPPAPSPLPPSAPPVQSSSPPPVAAPVHRPNPVRHRERRAVKHLARPRGPSSPRFEAASRHPQSAASFGAADSTLGRSSPSNDLTVVIVAIAFALSLIAVGAAFAPPRAVPGLALSLLYRHRSEVVLTGVVLMLGACVGLLVVLVLT